LHANFAFRFASLPGGLLRVLTGFLSSSDSCPPHSVTAHDVSLPLPFQKSSYFYSGPRPFSRPGMSRFLLFVIPFAEEVSESDVHHLFFLTFPPPFHCSPASVPLQIYFYFNLLDLPIPPSDLFLILYLLFFSLVCGYTVPLCIHTRHLALLLPGLSFLPSTSLLHIFYFLLS